MSAIILFYAVRLANLILLFILLNYKEFNLLMYLQKTKIYRE